jgi:membrane dipeptidase
MSGTEGIEMSADLHRRAVEVSLELTPPGCEDMSALAGFDVNAVVPGLDGPRGLPPVTEALLRRGHTEPDIRKILGENVHHLFRKELGRPA